jgi:diguanylate cyclase (GGDEF)-like protein
VSTVFTAIGADCRKAIDRAATTNGNIEGDRRTISSRIAQRVSGVLRNAAQPKEIASRLPESDYLDRLTGVGNRNHFQDHLEQMLRRKGGGYTLLTKCNVSRFHDINTSFGYDVGDALLIQVGQRLRTLPDAAIGRLSSDEFAVGLPLSEPDISAATVAHIRELLAPKFVLPGATIDVRFSIGYALGRAGDDSIALLRKAGIALHESVRSPFHDPIEFDQNAAIRIESRARLTSDLQQALENNQFLMHYQPKVELATGKIVGAEALLRWEHAVYGTQPPSRFIAAAEDSGLIVDIGAWALRHAARFAVRVNRGRLSPLAISVNVSPLQFRRDDLAQLLRTILEQTDAEPSWLMFELTESLLADDSPAMIATLRELRAMGVGLSVDDFGTGYSSLSRLEAFPISEFKIDRSFVSQVDQNRSKLVIVDAMIHLGKELQISVVAEGAETKDEVGVLRKLGCPYVQGHFFGRPMPEPDFVSFLDGSVSSLDQDDVVHHPSAVCAAGHSQSAMVVDDDPTVLAALSETLKHLGWLVTTAPSAEEALALPASFPAPQIVITDVNLGTGMDGFEFCPLARRRWPDVKIVVISGRPPHSEQLDTLSLHDVFLLKPVHMSALEAAIASRRADRID